MERKILEAPLNDESIMSFRAGDYISLRGIIYAARDAAHKRLTESLEREDKLPFNLEGQIIYYVGPTPARPGGVIGSAGPTTSGRMDKYTPLLLSRGMKACIGKGRRSDEVKEALIRYKGIYLAAVGGAGAYLAKRIVKSEVVAYPELGPEALYRFTVIDFPALVINDALGNDFYIEGMGKYAR